jgi:hypothetical protein
MINKENEMFDLDNEIINNVKGSWAAGEQGVQLPFSTVLFWWKRGGDDRADGTQKYGGWVASYENVIENGGGEIPSKLSQEQFQNYSGDLYEVYTTRNIAIAPIGKRFKWTYRSLPDGSKDPSDKGRGHLQVLGLSSFLNEQKEHVLWQPVILSAKGLSAKSLQDALADWDRKTIALRASECNGLPSNFFWVHLGTFGKEVKKLQVGRGNKSNYITPIQIFMPELNIDYLNKVYVGKNAAITMSVLAEQSQDWLKEWSKNSQDETTPDINIDDADYPDL